MTKRSRNCWQRPCGTGGCGGDARAGQTTLMFLPELVNGGLDSDAFADTGACGGIRARLDRVGTSHRSPP
jgi:hypothetical protein